MRQILYDRTGAPQHYLTGAGVLFDLTNAPVGAVQDAQVLNCAGRVVAWFDGGFVWDVSGVLAFIKGAKPQEGLVLPKTAPLRATLAPTPAPLQPLLQQRKPPPMSWRWSERTLADALSAALFG